MPSPGWQSSLNSLCKLPPELVVYAIQTHGAALWLFFCQSRSGVTRAAVGGESNVTRKSSQRNQPAEGYRHFGSCRRGRYARVWRRDESRCHYNHKLNYRFQYLMHRHSGR
jgi:hypothetical protein